MRLKSLLKQNETLLFIHDILKKWYYKYFFSGERLVQKQSKKHLGKKVNLQFPVEFNEKLQWLKLYWYDGLAAQCADKLEVREYVRERIGEEYLNQIYKVYNTAQDIDLEELPQSFVLKGTHGSGFVFVCKDKEKVDWKKTFKFLRRWLRQNYYYKNREWVYKDITPKIICEKYIFENENGASLTDYKFFCFNGEPKYCQVIRGRGLNETIDFYDQKWNHMPFTGLRDLPNSFHEYEKPEKYEEMLHLAKKLSTPFPFVRVDFYYVDKTIIFGELTFFPQSGYGSFYPKEWNKKMGKELNI